MPRHPVAIINRLMAPTNARPTARTSSFLTEALLENLLGAPPFSGAGIVRALLLSGTHVKARARTVGIAITVVQVTRSSREAPSPKARTGFFSRDRGGNPKEQCSACCQD